MQKIGTITKVRIAQTLIAVNVNAPTKACETSILTYELKPKLSTENQPTAKWKINNLTHTSERRNFPCQKISR